jgi:hypothetical protein
VTARKASDFLCRKRGKQLVYDIGYLAKEAEQTLHPIIFNAYWRHGSSG